MKISIVGGSNSVMRRGYVKYLSDELSRLTCKKTSINYYALGGVPNIFGTIQEDRHDIANQSDIIFFEYCVNDRHAIETDNYSLKLVGKSLEGFIRKCKKSNPYCLIMLLIFGVNHAEYYQQECQLSQIYEEIGKRYCLPVVNITKLLKQTKGINFVKSLYDAQDVAHYTRPTGVKVVSETIIKQLSKIGIISSLKSDKNAPKGLDIQAIYKDNFENLTFFDNFESANFFDRQPKTSVYQNSVYREKNFTLTQKNAMRFRLKGQLAAIYIKSDLNDGFIEINCGKQRIITSSYSAWVNKIKPQNVINLITLPLRRFEPSSDFVPVSIGCCSKHPDRYELDYVKEEPKRRDPRKWTLNIIGIAYIGELQPM
ncbi:MAG: hypothetical protein AAFO95_00725 [Cyanobacteria bacterium J06600_6]